MNSVQRRKLLHPAQFGGNPANSLMASYCEIDGQHRLVQRQMVIAAVVLLAVALTGQSSMAEDEGAVRSGYLVQIPLPITDEADQRFIRMIDRLLQRVAPADGQRPVLVLEFDPKEGQAGEASQFERCLTLARFLSSEKMSRLRTVAYLPRSVKGHAVLVAMACEEIVMSPDTQFGEAGYAEQRIEQVVRFSYRDIAERRGVMPVPFVLGMLDRDLEVFKVKTSTGARYVLTDELRELEEQGLAADVTTVTRAGELPSFSGAELRDTYRFVSYLAADRKELASVLELPQGSLEGDPSLDDSWRAVRIELRGQVEHKTVNWILQGLAARMHAGTTNLICVWIDSDGGAPEESLRLAHYLAEFEPAEVRTVAFIPRSARSDAALVALACDHIVMVDSAVLGGIAGDNQIDESVLTNLRSSIKSLAERKQRDWSLPAALIDPNLTVHRYAREGTGEVRYFCQEEHLEQENPDVWLRGGELATHDGLTGTRAEEIRVARYLAEDFEQFKQLYHLPEDPELLEPNWAQKWTDRLAEALSKPMIAGWILFAAMFFLSIEMSNPGLSVAGFVSALCFLAFFWSHYLNETAGILEILLFVLGTVFLLLEIFVIPGWGVFGIGGALMVIASVVLASQTFIVPQSSSDMKQLPGSLSMVLFSVGGIAAAVFVVRRFLPHAPYFNRMVLEPPSEEIEELDERESLVKWNHLAGKRGVTTTQLTPSGKARFGDDIVDVISDGAFIARGADIFAAEVHGSHVLVQPIENAESR